MLFSMVMKNITLSGSAEILIGFFEVMFASLLIYFDIVALKRIVWTSEWVWLMICLIYA
jgi:hypothetical protein